MNKLDWYYNQTVTQGQMDWTFEQVEAAICQAAKFSYGEGIIEGGEVTQVTPAAEIAVMVAAFKLRDEEGRHVELSDAIKVLCSVDYDGISTYTDLVAGQGRWISVYAAFKRDLSEPKSDGNSVVVMSKLLDYYELFVVRGPAGYVNGGDLFEDEAFTIPLDRPTKPSEYTSSNDFRPDAILLADIKITEDAPIILTADIDYTYRGDWIREEGFANIAPEALIAGTPRDGLIAFATWLDEYLAGMLTVGFWEGIGANDGQLFADASALAVVGDVTVKAVVNKLIETYTAYTGAAKTGVAAFNPGGGITIANGTLQTALERLATLLYNETVTRSGADSTLTSTKYNKTGGEVAGNIYPDADGTRTLGTDPLRYSQIYLTSANKTKNIPSCNATPELVAGVAGWDFADGRWESLTGDPLSLVVPIDIPVGSILNVVTISMAAEDTGGPSRDVTGILYKRLLSTGAKTSLGNFDDGTITIVNNTRTLCKFGDAVPLAETIAVGYQYYVILSALGADSVFFDGGYLSASFDQAISL